MEVKTAFKLMRESTGSKRKIKDEQVALVAEEQTIARTSRSR